MYKTESRGDLVKYFSSRGKNGIANVGNTCYLNTAIQCMFHNVELLQRIIADSHCKDGETNYMNELKELLSIIWIEGDSVVPHQFINYLKINIQDRMQVNVQNDVQEFMMTFLDVLNKDVACGISSTVIRNTSDKLLQNGLDPRQRLVLKMERDWYLSNKLDYSFLTEFFYGQFICQTECDTCHTRTHTSELFSNIPIAFASIDSEHNVQHHQLNALINNTFQTETITGYQCNKCKQITDAKRSVRIWKTPKLLTLSLKRFDKHLKKLYDKVDVPEHINITNICIYDQNSKYHLLSIACHGGSTTYGHYFALCRHPSGTWVVIDDEHVKDVDSYTTISSDSFYILIYEKNEN